MKIRHYGALTSAFLITLTGAAQASDAACPPPKAAHHVAARPAPARRNADAEAYAKSFYDYHSARPVSEVLVRRVAEQPADWQEAPNDARIRFQPADVGMVYGPPGQAVAINDNDFRGGVGDTEGGYNNGGGYGGQVILATPNAENGPNYNSYGESFQSNPSAAANFGQFQSQGMPHGYFPGTPPTR
jgi:hypothetical protein